MKGNMKKERIIASNTTGVFGAILVITHKDERQGKTSHLRLVK
jgi:hypothetical protein